MLIFLAGLPTIVAFSGTSFKITVLAPILEPSPTVIGPNIWALEPTITLFNKVGCLLLFLWSFEFSAGDIVSIYNNCGSDISILQDSGVTLRLVGDAGTGTRTLALRGLMTVTCVSSNEFVCSGGGMS